MVMEQGQDHGSRCDRNAPNQENYRVYPRSDAPSARLFPKQLLKPITIDPM